MDEGKRTLWALKNCSFRRESHMTLNLSIEYQTQGPGCQSVCMLRNACERNTCMFSEYSLLGTLKRFCVMNVDKRKLHAFMTLCGSSFGLYCYNYDRVFPWNPLFIRNLLRNGYKALQHEKAPFILFRRRLCPLFSVSEFQTSILCCNVL